MTQYRDGALAWHAFETLTDERVLHGVFTRRGGSSLGPFASLNVGHTVGDQVEHVEANHRAVYRALGVPAASVAAAHQVHGDRIARVTERNGGRVEPQTDALISNTPGLTLMLRFADCAPVLFYAPAHGAVGIAHAGWKGTMLKIAAKTALAMMSAFGCQPEEIRVGIGPAIGPCCLEVGPEVVAQAQDAFVGADALLSRPHDVGKAYFDLWRANEVQLREIGVSQIETIYRCTSCHRDVFFSHRAENGHTGRFPALIGLRPNT